MNGSDEPEQPISAGRQEIRKRRRPSQPMVDKSQQTEVSEKSKYPPTPQSSGPKTTHSIGNIPANKVNYKPLSVSSQLQKTWTKRKPRQDMVDKSLQTGADSKEEIKLTDEAAPKGKPIDIGGAASEIPESVQEVENTLNRQSFQVKIDRSQQTSCTGDWTIMFTCQVEKHDKGQQTFFSELELAGTVRPSTSFSKPKESMERRKSSQKSFSRELPESQPEISSNDDFRKESIMRPSLLQQTRPSKDEQEIPTETQPPAPEETYDEEQTEETTAEETRDEPLSPLPARETSAEEAPTGPQPLSAEATEEEAPTGPQPLPAEATEEEAPSGPQPLPAEATEEEAPSGPQPLPAEATEEEAPSGPQPLPAEATEEEAPSGPQPLPAEATEEEAPTEPQPLPAEATEEEASTEPQPLPAEATEEEAPSGPQSLPAEATEEEAPTEPQSLPAEATEEEASTEPQPLPAEATEEEAPSGPQPLPAEATEEEALTEPQPLSTEESIAEKSPVVDTQPPSDETPGEEASLRVLFPADPEATKEETPDEVPPLVTRIIPVIELPSEDTSITSQSLVPEDVSIATTFNVIRPSLGKEILTENTFPDNQPSSAEDSSQMEATSAMYPFPAEETEVSAEANPVEVESLITEDPSDKLQAQQDEETPERTSETQQNISEVTSSHKQHTPIQEISISEISVKNITSDNQPSTFEQTVTNEAPLDNATTEMNSSETTDAQIEGKRSLVLEAEINAVEVLELDPDSKKSLDNKDEKSPTIEIEGVISIQLK